MYDYSITNLKFQHKLQYIIFSKILISKIDLLFFIIIT
jgi:hypothetical protein